jgi:hypothetical protein
MMASAHAQSKGAGSASTQETELASKILDLVLPDKRESALLHLSKHREVFPDLAPMLWWSVGTMSALLQEIVAIYPALTPPVLTAPASNRVCNALALLQCVASHSETRHHFLEGQPISVAARLANVAALLRWCEAAPFHSCQFPCLLVPTQHTLRCIYTRFLAPRQMPSPSSISGSPPSVL